MARLKSCSTADVHSTLNSTLPNRLRLVPACFDESWLAAGALSAMHSSGRATKAKPQRDGKCAGMDRPPSEQKCNVSRADTVSTLSSAATPRHASPDGAPPLTTDFLDNFGATVMGTRASLLTAPRVPPAG